MFLPLVFSFTIILYSHTYLNLQIKKNLHNTWFDVFCLWNAFDGGLQLAILTILLVVCKIEFYVSNIYLWLHSLLIITGLYAVCGSQNKLIVLVNFCYATPAIVSLSCGVWSILSSHHRFLRYNFTFSI